MKVTYSPEDGEKQVFDFNPNKLLSAEREALEKRTGMSFKDFSVGVIDGSSVCRRAMLHVLLKRQHPTLSYDDVDFLWDELTVEATKGEIELMVQRARDNNASEAFIENLLKNLPTAPEDEGKARLPIAV